MTRVIGFHVNYATAVSGYRKNAIYDGIVAIARSVGLEPPKPSDVHSSPQTLDALEAGDTVVCLSIVDLSDDITQIGPVIRSLVGRGVKVVTGEVPDVVTALRLIEAISARMKDMQTELAQLRKDAKSGEALVREASAAIAARMTDRLGHTLAALNQSFLSEEYATEFLAERKRLLEAKKAVKKETA